MSAPLIVWGDPPPPQRARAGQWDPVIEQLKTRPGEWACVQRAPEKSRANHFASSLRKAAIRGGYPLEVTQRKTAGGDHGLWARWVAK